MQRKLSYKQSLANIRPEASNIHGASKISSGEIKIPRHSRVGKVRISHWWSKVKKYLFILLISLIGFFVLKYLNSYFQIKTIVVVGDIRVKELKGLENLKGKNIYSLTEAHIEDTLTESNPNFLLAEVIKEFPNKLRLKLILIEPLASLKLNQGYAFLSVEGKIIKKSKAKYLPVINFYQSFDYYQTKVGNKLDYKEVATTLKLLQKSQDLGLKIDNIDINGLSMIVFTVKESGDTKTKKKIFFTAEKSLEKQVFELETIIKQFKIEAKDYQELDLRFDKPIIKF